MRLGGGGGDGVRGWIRGAGASRAYLRGEGMVGARRRLSARRAMAGAMLG